MLPSDYRCCILARLIWVSVLIMHSNGRGPFYAMNFYPFENKIPFWVEFTFTGPHQNKPSLVNGIKPGRWLHFGAHFGF